MLGRRCPFPYEFDSRIYIAFQWRMFHMSRHIHRIRSASDSTNTWLVSILFWSVWAKLATGRTYTIEIVILFRWWDNTLLRFENEKSMFERLLQRRHSDQKPVGYHLDGYQSNELQWNRLFLWRFGKRIARWVDDSTSPRETHFSTGANKRFILFSSVGSALRSSTTVQPGSILTNHLRSKWIIASRPCFMLCPFQSKTIASTSCHFSGLQRIWKWDSGIVLIRIHLPTWSKTKPIASANQTTSDGTSRCQTEQYSWAWSWSE